MGGSVSPVWTGMEKTKSLAVAGFEPQNVQPIASLHTGQSLILGTK
jgi:hypothetical protein